MSEPLTPDLERWARGSFSPMAQRHAWNEIDRLRDELRQLREAAEPIAQIEIIPGAPGDGALVGLGYSWMELEPMPCVSDLRKLAALLPAKGAAK